MIRANRFGQDLERLSIESFCLTVLLLDDLQASEILKAKCEIEGMSSSLVLEN